ncbi:MAG: enoyl-CoA hydratase/isomerase family protein [Sediminibacterium sp.]|nr:MAG: enoyl-CoA hydratase/isomerase family protein [Sediminibacterium sp.]
MKYEHIILEIHNKIAWIKFNRPEQLNAMNTLMMDEIIHALDFVNKADSKEIGVVVITGAGKAFMAGADIKEYAQQTEAQFDAFQLKGHSLYAGIENNSKVVIAAINGYAFGGGFEIALACDLIVAAAGIKMGLPEILLNLIPGGGGSLRLTKKIGINLSNEIVMTGRTILAEEMNARGVINYIYPRENFIEKVTEFAQIFAEQLPDRLQAIKQLTQEAANGITPALQAKEAAALSKFYRSKEGQEKIQAFYNKSLEKK